VAVSHASWTLIADYGLDSQFFHCSTCGMPHRTGTDEPVLRGNHIDMEGFYDICVDCARHAGKLVGLIDPEQIDAAVAENVELKEANDGLARKLEAAQKLLEAYETAEDAGL